MNIWIETVSHSTFQALGVMATTVGILCIALSRGIRATSFSLLGLKLDIDTPIQTKGLRVLSVFGGIFLIAGLASAAWGSYHVLFPNVWPDRYQQVRSAEMRLFDVDDTMYVRVKGVDVGKATYGTSSAWIDVKDHLITGMNVFEFIVVNGKYGGCGGTASLRMNSVLREPFWSQSVKENQLPDIVCFQETRTVELK